MRESKKSLAARLAKIDAHVIQPEEYDEAPELTDEMLARAEIRIGGKIVQRGRPPIPHPREAIKLRLSPEVLEHFRATGAGLADAHQRNLDAQRAPGEASRAGQACGRPQEANRAGARLGNLRVRRPCPSGSRARPFLPRHPPRLVMQIG